MGKHTSGTWKLVEDFIDDTYHIITSERELEDLCEIASIDTLFEGDFGKEQEANARLILAAPDLLAALERLADLASRCDGWESFPSSALDDAYAVIAKAKVGE